MAIYHCKVKVMKRSKGQSSTAAAAYRCAMEITDERTGQVHDYTSKTGVDVTAILAPDHAPDWVADRSRLWNEVEKIEKRKDAQVAREMVVAIPRELSPDLQRSLVMDYARSQFVSAGMIADVAIHEMGTGNPHAHILLTMREIGQSGFGKKNRDWNDRSQLQAWRAAWSDHANLALEQEGVAARIDHRSYAEQGLEIEPTRHLGKNVHQMIMQEMDADALPRMAQLNEATKTHNAVIIDMAEKRMERQARLEAERVSAADQEAELTREIQREMEAVAAQARELAQAQAVQAERDAVQAERDAQVREFARLSESDLQELIDSMAPPSLEELIDQQRKVKRATESLSTATTNLSTAQEEQRIALKAASEWRKEHPIRNWLHHKGLFVSSRLKTLADEYDTATKASSSAQGWVDLHTPSVANNRELARSECEAQLAELLAPSQLYRDALELKRAERGIGSITLDPSGVPSQRPDRSQLRTVQEKEITVTPQPKQSRGYGR